MQNSAKDIVSDNFLENELNHLRNIDTLINLAITHIDKKVNDIDFFEKDSDSDNVFFTTETAEFNYFDLRVWIDIDISNDSFIIQETDIKNNDDIDYRHLSLYLKQDLIKYYSTESTQRALSYKQSLEIQHDQNDPYNLEPNKAIGFEINKKYLEDIKSICEEEDDKLLLFLKLGFAGHELRLKDKVKCTDLVRKILPLINKNIFEQVSLLSEKKDVARFIAGNFRKNKGETFNLRTLENTISKLYSAS